MSDLLQIATRKSPLALKQTAMVRAWLSKKLPSATFENLELSTKVDERLKWSLEKRGGIGLFTKELEDALIGGRAGLAVHSAKDMPTTLPKDLAIAGYLPRGRVNDILVHRCDCPTLKTIATSSPRRRAQLNLLPASIATRFTSTEPLEWTTIRGNVGTRLGKIAAGECDASLLAAAGLDRLEIKTFEGLEFVELSVEHIVPAPGQGAIAIQCRREDLPEYQGLFCEKTQLAVELEKGFLSRLGSGCQIPVGAYYCKNTFHIFHTETGYRSFEVELQSIDQIEAALDAIFNELPLSNIKGTSENLP